jgi:hypothetical protein
MDFLDSVRNVIAKRPVLSSFISFYLGTHTEKKGWLVEALRAIFL